MERIMTNRMDRGYYAYQAEYEEAALRALRSGWYILGKEVEAFEKEYAGYTGAAYAVGVGNGLDALSMACRAVGIGEGDEVIVQANTYIASIMGITIPGGTPVFVEPDRYHRIDPAAIEKAITSRTKAMMVVHLYGQTAEMDRISAICREHGLKLIEDCAQSHGARWGGRMSGTWGDIGCFSFYPSKNLGAFGDAGAVVTDSEEYRDRIRRLRNYGSSVRYHFEEVGMNSRLDELQAALLRVRLTHLDEMNRERKRIAKRYDDGIVNPAVEKPQIAEGAEHVYHQYVIRSAKRDALASYLKEEGIDTIIHYPIPPHLSEAYAYLGHKKGDLPFTEELADTVLSIPMYNGMTQEEQERVIDALNAWKG